MSSSLRLELKGTLFHIIIRGNEPKYIYLESTEKDITLVSVLTG